MIEAAKSLGYNSIGLNNPRIKDDVIINRLDLDPKNQNQLNQILRNNRWKTEIITVNCRTKAIARQAGRDRRIDFVTYPLTDKWKNNHLDRQQAGLMRDTGSGYLINASELLVNDAHMLRRRIDFIKRNLDNASKKGLPIAVSSFASNPLELRDPYGLASLLSLLDVAEDYALEMVSSIPYALVEKNRAKLKDSYIQDGVWVIEDE